MQLRPSDATNLAGVDTGRRHLSHSRISVLLACPRKYELSYLKNLELISRPDPLTMGGAFHQGIAALDPEVGVLALQTGRPAPTDQQEEDRQRIAEQTIRSAVALYLRQWPEGPGETREVEFRVRLRNPETGHYSHTYDLEGSADGVMDVGDWRLADTGAGTQVELMRPLGLIENKLVGTITALRARHIPLDQQCALYRYGLWRATGRAVRRVSYRWVRRPSIRPKTKQGEAIDQFLDRLAADYEDRPDHYFHAEDYFATADDLLRIEAELWRLAEMIRVQERTLCVRNTNHCTHFGGCAFMPICSGDPDAMSLYQPKTDRNDKPTPEGEAE